MSEVHTPKNISITQLTKKGYSFSPHSYKRVLIKNQNCKSLRDFLLRTPAVGEEVGSAAYTQKSNKFFIRNKALEEGSYLLQDTIQSIIPILPRKFTDFNLTKGDILISKDSNIGEVVILEKDYPDHTISGGLYKILLKEPKYYLLSAIKQNFFRDQLNFAVSRAATIRHAGQTFLDCLIPFPTQTNSADVIARIELLTKSVITKEAQIKENFAEIQKIISTELSENQKQNGFRYNFPTIEEITKVGRLDTGLYNREFKELVFRIESYIRGAETLKKRGYQILRGPNLAVTVIGKSIYSNEPKKGFYNLIEPTDLSDYGTVKHRRFLGNKTKIQCLNSGDIVFGAEGNIGKLFVVCEEIDKSITNYHGMSITNREAPLHEKIFIAMFMFFLREKRFFEHFSVGGQGGSFGKEKTENILIPNFPDKVQKNIAKLYFDPGGSGLGILQLDSQIKKEKLEIEDLFKSIVQDTPIKL